MSSVSRGFRPNKSEKAGITLKRLAARAAASMRPGRTMRRCIALSVVATIRSLLAPNQVAFVVQDAAADRTVDGGAEGFVDLLAHALEAQVWAASFTSPRTFLTRSTT